MLKRFVIIMGFLNLACAALNAAIGRWPIAAVNLAVGLAVLGSVLWAEPFK